MHLESLPILLRKIFRTGSQEEMTSAALVSNDNKFSTSHNISDHFLASFPLVRVFVFISVVCFAMW